MANKEAESIKKPYTRRSFNITMIEAIQISVRQCGVVKAGTAQGWRERKLMEKMDLEISYIPFSPLLQLCLCQSVVQFNEYRVATFPFYSFIKMMPRKVLVCHPTKYRICTLESPTFCLNATGEMSIIGRKEASQQLWIALLSY